MLVGRDDILHRIRSALSAARRGDGSGIALTGDPGAGKTALLEFARGEAKDMQVLGVRGVEWESSLAYAGLADLVSPLLDLSATLPGPQAAALAAALRRGPALHVDRFAVCTAVVTLLSEAARLRPIVVIVDDAHWLDAPSIEVLLFLARRIAVTAVCALFAYRDGPGLAPAPDFLTRITVPGLTAAAGAQLLAASNSPIDAAAVAWLMAETGGNPLALTDLPTLLSTDEIDTLARTRRRAPLPRSLEQFYGQIAGRLPEDAQRALLVASMLDGRGIGLLRHVLARSDLAAADLVPAADAGLLSIVDGEVALRHPLVRSAVHQAATAQARREAHLAVAAGLADSVDPELTDARAWHLADAAPGWDDEAADLLEQAGRGAYERSGLRAAAIAFERSAQLTTNLERRDRRLLDAATAELEAGRTARCLILLDRIDAAQSADVLQIRGRVEMWTGEPMAGGERLVAVAERVIAAEPLRAFTLLIDAATGMAMSGSLDRAHELGQLIQSIGRSLGSPADRIAEATLAGIVALRGHRADVAAILDDAVEALLMQRPGPLAEIGTYAAWGYLFVDRLDTARDIFGTSVRRCRDAGALSMLSFALSGLSYVEFRNGRWDTAYGAGLESAALAEETGRRTDIPNCLVAASLVEAARGWPAARVHAERARDLAAGIELRVVEAQASSVLGLLDLGLGNMGAAEDQLERSGAIARETGAHQVCHLQWAPELVEALTRSGRPRTAAPTVEYLNERAATLNIPFASAVAARCRGLVATGRTYDAAFEQALAQHARGAARPFETARTHLAYGERLRRDRRRKDARRHLLAAWQIFQQLGAEPWTKRAADELHAAGIAVSNRPPDALGILTAQERHVASTVASGATNREVARRLFLSEKTVEFHLSNIYRKLDLTSRAQLARLMELV